MAKGKRAAALFEVIQASKEREQLRATGGGFMTPSWWFKSKQRNNGAPAAPSNPPPAARSEATTPSRNVLPAAPAPIVPEPDEPESSSEPVETMRIASPDPESEEHPGQTDESLSATFTPEPSPPPVHHEFVDNEEPALEDPKPAPVIKPAPRPARTALRSSVHKPVDVAVDRGRQQIVLRLSFTSAAISTFAIIVVVALIVLITKSYTHGPNTADAASITNVKNGKAYPSVMSVFQGKGEEPAINVAPAPKTVPQQRVTPQQPKTAGKPGETPKQTLQPPPKPQQPQGLNAAGKRIVGEQYVLIQSYPDPEDANDARDALVKAGIQCTVEKGTRWAPTWSCVIGTRGFDHTKNNAEFEAYMKSIRDVSNTFAGSSKFRRFEPQVIGWKE